MSELVQGKIDATRVDIAVDGTRPRLYECMQAVCSLQCLKSVEDSQKIKRKPCTIVQAKIKPLHCARALDGQSSFVRAELC